MKKNILKTLLGLFAIAAVSSDYAAFGQHGKGLTRSIIINNGDTVVNGRKFNELSKDERAKLREEFKEMERNFRGFGRGATNDSFIRRSEDGDVAISRNRKEPKVLYWDDDISDDVSFDFKGRIPRNLNVYGDSMKNRGFHVFKFDGDSSFAFGFNTDSLLKRFEMHGLDSNLRKRIITMHRDLVPGRPGGMILRGDAPQMSFERHAFPGFSERNNSSSFNYSHTDKDGVSSRMSIRISDAGREQLKKLTGAEAIAKPLDVSDLTLFPNFSSGKMTFSFNLSSKGTTKINILDSDLKQIFADDAANFSGNYVKQITLPKNGVYYVTVNQNGNWFVKRLVKE